MRWRRNSAVLLGAIISIALLFLAVSRLDPGKMLDIIKNASFSPWVPLAILSYLLGHIVRGVRCRLLVSLESTITLTDAVQVVILGYAVNNLLPARLGEFFRAGLLSERTGLPYVQTLTVTVLERIFDGLALLFFLAVTSLVFPANFAVSNLRFAGLLFGAMAVILFFMRIFPHSFISFCSRMTYPMGSRFHDFMIRAMSHTIQGIGYLKGVSELFLIAGLSLVVWFLEAGMFLLLLPAIGLSMNIWVALFAMAVTNLAIMIPSTPGYIGVFHFFCMQALVVTGVNSETAFGFAGLVHLVFYIPITFLGILIILAYQMRVGETIALATSAIPALDTGRILATGRPRKETAPPGKMIVAIVEVMIPQLPHPEDVRVAAETLAPFVQGQINSLSARLRFLLQSGLVTFNVVTFFTHFRTFSKLDPALRRKWLYRWAFGPIPITRHLFRPFRTAILAFYDLPIAQTTLEFYGQS